MKNPGPARTTSARPSLWAAGAALATAAAVALPAVAAAQTPVPPPVAPAAGAHAPGGNGGDGISLERPEGKWTLGTRVQAVNHTGKPLWFQQYWPFEGWKTPIKIENGESYWQDGDFALIDDVEMRFYTKASDAMTEKNSKDIDAANPSGTSPWMSVGGDMKYFHASGATQEWRQWIGQEHYRFAAERHADSKDYKELVVVIDRLS